MFSRFIWKFISIIAMLNLSQAKILYLKTLVFLDKIGLLHKMVGSAVGNPVKVMNMHFSNQLGLGAGFDVNGDFVETLSKLKFGFLEFGTVTPHAQINREFSSLMRLYPQNKSVVSNDHNQNMGVDYLVNKLETCSYKGIIGIQINKNNVTPDINLIDDLQYCMRKVINVANYVAIQVPDIIANDHVMLDDLFNKLKATQTHLYAVHALYLSIVVKVPAKIEFHDLKNFAKCVLKYKIDAVNACYPKHITSPVTGNLFGGAIQKQANQIQAKLMDLLAGKVPIIASGGVVNKREAISRIRDGAQLVQIYSGIFFSGPRFIKELTSELFSKA
jgi:dihydroorotate dehydrogenase